MLAQLAELRTMILGDLSEGWRESLKAFRAALRRVFVGFESIQRTRRSAGSHLVPLTWAA